MKIRAGFVANSSSSSFVIIGLIISDKEAKRIREFVEGHSVVRFVTKNDPGYWGDHVQMIGVDIETDVVRRPMGPFIVRQEIAFLEFIQEHRVKPALKGDGPQIFSGEESY